MAKFYNPVKLYFENSGMVQLKEDLKDINAENILIITWNKALFATDSILLNLLPPQVYKKIIAFDQSNPDMEDILAMSEEIKDFSFDFILAVGGGSVIDISKSLVALKHQEFETIEQLRDIIVNGKYEIGLEEIPMLAIPTTSGTGSEVTPWGTIWDREFNKKYSISSSKLFPAYALILPELTMKLPLRSTISTGLDALCHATEAYWSMHSNPISRSYSLQAIAMILQQLERNDFALDNYEIRKQLAMGSVLAGLSFSNTRTTACHSISYPLTLHYNIDHGIAVSMTLGKMFEHNQQRIIDLPSLLSAFQVEDVKDVEKRIIEIYKKYDIPFRLMDYQVKRSDLSIIASQSFTKGRMDNNPVDLTEHDIEQLLNSII
ncbi:phosphonoacetaldehyde reductase [Ornithinibacillus sp. 4-3]|uniref:Phosphonoacetaldehyde reductase n=1 Tax=Ornithinibacillus sp. 4-3 TaxID=3231488 RepID=A0AB39HS89_9BACI